MKWDQERPAKAAVERCRVCLDSPPTGDFGFSFLIYPPTRAQWRARAGGLRRGFPSSAEPICMGFAKNGLASSHTRKACGGPPAAWARAAYPSRATYPIPPAYLPYTPGTPTLYPRRTHPIPPGPPASRPTAYLPQHTYPTLLADLP